MTPLAEIIVAVLLIIGNILIAIHLIIAVIINNRYIHRKKQIAVHNHNLKQIKRLRAIADEFTTFENEIRFIITLPSIESRINRYNLLEERYNNLVLKIIEVITDEKMTIPQESNAEKETS